MRTSSFFSGLWSTALLVLLGCGLSDPVQASDQTIIVVRHAEKSTAPTDDPVLTELGIQQAQRLADALQHAKIRTIITTHWQRSRATAAPLAKRLQLTPVVIDAVKGEDIQAHIDRVTHAARKHSKHNALIVGHSNTVPLIVKSLGGFAIAPMQDHEFDRMIVLSRNSKHWRMIEARY